MENYPWLSLTFPGSWEPYDTNFNTSAVASLVSHANFDDNNCMDHNLDPPAFISGVRWEGPQHSLTPEILSKLWRIPLSQACCTIQVTEQHSLRRQEGSISQ